MPTLVKLRILCFLFTLLVVVVPYMLLRDGEPLKAGERIILATAFYLVYMYIYKKNKRKIYTSESISDINGLLPWLNKTKQVLLLRTFLTEKEYQAYERVSFNPLQPISLLFDDPLTLEEEVVKAFQVHEYQPIAIGNPKNNFLYLGAKRIFLSDQKTNWTSYAKLLIDHSQFICIMGYGGMGLRYEVELCLKSNMRTPVIVFFPGEKSEIKKFRAFYNKYQLSHFELKPNGSKIGGAIIVHGGSITIVHFKTGFFSVPRYFIWGRLNRLLSETITNSPTPRKSLFKQNILANCIDLAVAVLVYFLVLLLVADETAQIIIIAGFFMLANLDWGYLGTSIGKRLMQVKILDKDGVRPTSTQLLIRSTLKLLFLMLLPFTLMLSLKHHTLVYAHDYFSSTSKFINKNDTP